MSTGEPLLADAIRILADVAACTGRPGKPAEVTLRKLLTDKGMSHAKQIGRLISL